MVEEVVSSECVHYWKIEPPNGPTSKAVCKYCGAERELWNFFGGDANVTVVSFPTCGYVGRRTRDDWA